MTVAGNLPEATVPPEPPAPPPSDRAVQLRAAAYLIGILAVVGAVLGPIWEVWSPPGPAGAVLSQGVQADETEAFASGDGKFTVLMIIIGVAIGIVAFLVRPFRSARGPYVAVALAIGGVIGAALTELVGYLIRGQGTHYHCAAASGTCIDHLPLTVHMHGALLVEAVLAVLVYSLFVAFAVDDDLGRRDAVRESTDEPDAESVGSSHPG